MVKKIIEKILQIELLKVSSLAGISTLIKLSAQLIVSKVIVVVAGPNGLVLLGQLTNVTTIFQTFSVGGITTGVTKYISEYEYDKPLQKKIILNSIKITFYCSLITSVFIIVFYKYITNYFFSNHNYETIVLVLGSTIFIIGFNNLFVSILNGLKRYKSFVTLNITSSIIGLIITVTLIYYWGIKGALTAYLIAPCFMIFFAFKYIKNEANFKEIFSKPVPDFWVTKKLFGFSIMLFNNSIVGSFALIFIRSLLITNISTKSAAIWEAMNRLSSAYLLIIVSSIQVYYLPTLSSIIEKKKITEEIIKTQKIIIPVCIVLFTMIYFLRNFIIQLLFSEEFNELNSLLPYQLVGDVIKITAWLISYTLYAKSMTKALVLSDNIFTITNILFIYLFIDSQKVTSVYIAHIINNCIYLVFMIYFYRNHVLRKQ